MPASRPALPSRVPAYIIAGLVHAAAMLLAFPPVGFWPMVFVAPMPLIWAGWIRGQDLISTHGTRSRLGRGPIWVSLASSPLHLYAHQWVIDVSALGYPPYIFIMSAWSGVFVWMLSRVVARWPRVPLVVVAPILWTAVEVFRGEVFFTGYPWIMVAHPLIEAPWIPAAASVLGTYFVGFLVAVVASAAMDVLADRGRRQWAIWGVTGVGATVALCAALRPSSTGHEGTVRIGVVQTDIAQSNKLEWRFDDRLKSLERFSALTRQAAARKPDVIVWPETMFPGITLSESGVREERAARLSFQVPASVDPSGVMRSTEFYERLMALSASIEPPMLVGALGFEGLSITPGADNSLNFSQKAKYNSVFLVSKGVVDPARHDKLELTPFGEIMPYIRHWPWLQKTMMDVGAGGMSFDLAMGTTPHVFSLPGKGDLAIVTPICFEATKPGLCRKLVRAAGGRPGIMVNLTNDGWFGEFRAGRLQHLQAARWRCVELGVPMVRAANTGMSAVIGDDGRVWTQLGSRADGVLRAEVGVHPGAGETLYARRGEWAGWASLTGSTVLAGWALIRRRTQSARGPLTKA